MGLGHERKTWNTWNRGSYTSRSRANCQKKSWGAGEWRAGDTGHYRGIRPEGGMPDAEGSEKDVSTQAIYAPDTCDHAEKNFTN